MPQPIARMYSGQETASAAAQELRDNGFSTDAIHVVAKPESQATTTTDAGASGPASAADPVLDAVKQTGVPPAHADIYADGIRRGEVLVVVVPPFGYAGAAEEILQRHEPIAVDVPQVETVTNTAVDWRSAAPLSSWLGWPVLSSDPAPLSTWLKRPTLKPEPAASKTLNKIRDQSRDAAPLSTKIGMPALSDNAAPLSTKLGWRLLGYKPAPLSTRFGWRTLSDNPAPLSSKFGWRLLSDNPTPLSSALGWSVLSKKQ